MVEPADGVTEVTDGAVDEHVTLKDLTQIVLGLARDMKEIAARPAVREVVREVHNSNEPGELPRAKTTKEILAGMGRGETRQGQDRYDPRGKGPYRPDNIIELTDKDKSTALRAAYELSTDEPIYGVVQAFMYRRKRDGQCKYRVDFGRRFGDDGIMEDQMRLVEAA